MTETYHQLHVSLNTPIKKIRNLNLNSSPVNYDIHEDRQDDHSHHHQCPSYLSQGTHSTFPTQPQASTKLYPSLDLQKSPTESSMLNKGYSHKLTNNVLSELHMRAQQITTGQNGSDNIQSSNTSPSYGMDDQVSQRRNKRYSGVHMSKFKQMESISHHYSVHNRNKTPSPQKSQPEDGTEGTNSNGTIESASKRRRTLNGNNEIMAIPILHQQQKRQPSNFTENRKISPNKISPSKASYNLNSILRQTTDTGSPNKEIWTQPPPKVPQLKKRPSSLEMAGVINSSPTRYNETGSGTLKSSMLQMDKPTSNNNVSSLLKEPSKFNGSAQQHDNSHNLPNRPGSSRSFVKPSSPQQQQLSLHKKSSIPQLQKKSSIPQLQKKSSIPQLQKKSSIHQLPKKPSIPQLQKKTSIPQLQRKPSIPQFHHNDQSNRNATTSSMKTAMKPPTSINLHHQNQTLQSSTKHLNEASTQPFISRMSPSKSFSSFKQHTSQGGNAVSHKNQPQSNIHGGQRVDTSKATTLPKSKSITIPQPFSLYDKPTISSSQKSLNKYQRFKEKFN
ncbi:hypothetical protein CORT_0E04720 [Candida orthopsilosis Co 90-125]|uniref:Uncharacterized protein n=1 Tax=Candida orthopsilosis (strain 90-125) TaxID=1136231 RepID=H8X7C8_CANO9|nr:hypothetical protein CORT_0E04720 [Candida orthopsilosis Co 90-125]CCG24057.1 hypothetical protein CORT_0E04720 [Candida orthopsilosis Co 90-125]